MSLLLRPLRTTTDRAAAERSPWLYGETPTGYRLTPLGVINTVRINLGLRPWALRGRRE